MRLFLRGPLRAEAALGRSGLRIVHVVVTDAFAGVERYMCQVANGLAARGHTVEVVGGDPARMTAELGGTSPPPGRHPAPATAALVAARGADIVHAHMTAAEAAAFLARPVDRAPVVATRHFAADRGASPLHRRWPGSTSRPIVAEIAISEFVARSVAGPTTLIPNAVADRPQARLDAPRWSYAPAVDQEKAPDVGIRAWADSGLGDRGGTWSSAGDRRRCCPSSTASPISWAATGRRLRRAR